MPVRGEAEIRAFNQTRLELFRKDKATTCVSRADCDVFTLGAGSALVIVNWELQRADRHARARVAALLQHGALAGGVENSRVDVFAGVVSALLR